MRETVLDRCLYASDEMQSFIRGSPRFHRSEVVNKQINYNYIAERYKKTFSNHVNSVRTAEVEKEISAILGRMNSGMHNLERMASQCTENLEALTRMDSGINKFMDIASDTKEFYADGPSERVSVVVFDNPYRELIDWCKCNLLSVSGLIDCIYRQYELQRYKNSIIEKIEEEKKELAERHGGKRKLLDVFTKKSSEGRIRKIEAKIELMARLVANLNIILDISAGLVINEYYPRFKSEKREEFMKFVEMSKVQHRKAFQIFENYFS